jgi:hypothetical protein
LLNCAETLLELLEQESDSNFSDILTLRKLRTSIKLKTTFSDGLFQERFLTAVRTAKGKTVTCIPF